MYYRVSNITVEVIKMEAIEITIVALLSKVDDVIADLLGST